MNDERDEDGRIHEVPPVTFQVRRAEFGVAVGFSPLLVLMGGLLGFLAVITQRAVEGVGGIIALVVFGLFGAVALVLPVWLIRRVWREGELVIDPVRGEIRISRKDQIPFSRIRQIEVVRHEYTYRGAGLEGGSLSADVTGWGIDIGGGSRLLAENGLSRKRIAEIADALKLRVEAYRSRSGQGADPLPRPGSESLARMAGSLRAENAEFEEDWLALDGPMAEWMREMHEEPDDHTMGRDGEFAQALRRAGFDLGAAPVAETTSSDHPR